MQERASRQDLVVPPKGVSAASLVIGAMLCGLAGFAVVWVAGIGRTVPVTNMPTPVVTNGNPPKPATSTSDRLAENPMAEPPTGTRFSSESPDYDPAVQPATTFATASTSRFSGQPVAFEEPADPAVASGDAKATETLDQPSTALSRFSNKQFSPPALTPPAVPSPAAEQTEQNAEPTAAKPQGTPAPSAADVTKPDAAGSAATKPEQEQTPAEHAAAAEETATSPADLTSNAPTPSETAALLAEDLLVADSLAAGAATAEAAKTLTTSALPAAPATGETTATNPNSQKMASAVPASKPDATAPPKAVATPAAEQPAETAAAATTVNDEALLAAPTARSATSTETVASSTPPEPAATMAAPKTPQARPDELVDTSPTTPKPAEAAPLNQPPQPLAADRRAAPLTAGVNPFALPSPTKTPANSSLQNTGVAMPFAAAPAIGKSSTAEPASTPPAQLTPPPALPTAGTTGQGRPGVPQLEGVQTPQLTIEKSGPRDLQVGKPARFEVTIRNVGAATAYDTVLSDAVPFGTTLMTTIPPASPAGPHEPSGTLSWAIGELKPGQEARVAMEVMPQQEGEVGSVASVRFRADATVRSRVTKPALAIVAEPLTPTLIGKPMTVALTLTNPGTGTATGVVVEGLLPEAVSHPAGREVEFDVGQLEPGEAKQITLVLQTVTPGVHEVILGARADGDVEVTQKLRAEITAPTLELAADIPSRRYLQRPATCTIRMSNTGTAPALAVELAAQLPAGVKFVRANNAGYYDERTHRVLWSLEELPAGEVGAVELVVMPTTLGPQPLVVATRNPAGLADQLSHTIEVEGLAALSFEVTDSEDPIELGGMTEYVVRVVNEGTKAATNVALVAKLLGDLEPVTAQGPVPFEVENLQVAFDPLASLAPADEAVFRVRVRGQKPGNQRVQFLLQSDDLETPLTSEELTHVYADR